MKNSFKQTIIKNEKTFNFYIAKNVEWQNF